MLVTEPGERLMLPVFGVVGIKVRAVVEITPPPPVESNANSMIGIYGRVFWAIRSNARSIRRLLRVT